MTRFFCMLIFSAFVIGARAQVAFVVKDTTGEKVYEMKKKQVFYFKTDSAGKLNRCKIVNRKRYGHLVYKVNNRITDTLNTDQIVYIQFHKRSRFNKIFVPSAFSLIALSSAYIIVEASSGGSKVGNALYVVPSLVTTGSVMILFINHIVTSFTPHIRLTKGRNLLIVQPVHQEK